jgi:hypothetical protein
MRKLATFSGLTVFTALIIHRIFFVQGHRVSFILLIIASASASIFLISSFIDALQSGDNRAKIKNIVALMVLMSLVVYWDTLV